MMHDSRGETIVEVLLSAALIGLAITTSFGIARRSLDLGAEARERVQALKIAESQVEMLKFYADEEEAPRIFSQSGAFCLDHNRALSSTDTTTVPSEPSTWRSYPGHVEIKTTDLDCQATVAEGFPESNVEVSITHDPDGPNDGASIFDDNLFTVRVSWDEVRAGNRDQLVITYRLHP
ncbi:MAG: type II secretion system protein [Patescibacteria group bacterium]